QSFGLHAGARRRQAHVQSAVTDSEGQPTGVRWGTIMLLQRLLLSGFVAIGVATTAITSAAAQPFTGRVAGGVIRDANALVNRIRAYRRGPGSWSGLTPVPGSYCPTMRAGEATLKELARLASRAILYRQPGLALRLQGAGDALSDVLDEEEEVNQQAGIPYTVYPCPVPAAPYPAPAIAVRVVEQRMPAGGGHGAALRLSSDARVSRMQQCLRRPGL